MKLVWIAVGLFAVLTIAVLITAYVCFRMAFVAPKRKPLGENELHLPVGKAYEPFLADIEVWAREVRAMPHEEVSITSFDGLTLHGKYYEYAPGAPIELLFHGYRGTAERDLSGGVQRCFKMGRSVLLVDQRGSGKSGGRIITFGIKEHRDCLSWVDFMVAHFGEDVKIIPGGISMGAATVLLTADKPMPKNVVGIMADCGYTSPREIIETVIQRRGLSVKLVYPFVRLGAIVYGGFDPEAMSQREAVRHSRLPILFIHGEADGYVPCDMSRSNYEACTSRKKLVTVPGADHGLSYLVAPETYVAAAGSFFDDGSEG